MRRAGAVVDSLVVALALLGAGCRNGPAAPAAKPETRGVAPGSPSLAVFAPLPHAVAPESGAVNDNAVTLGRMLFYEPRLSRSQAISCDTCHPLDEYGADGRPISDGDRGQRGTRNAPTVFNAAAHFAQFWDGRAPDVEAQAKGPVLNPVEMAMPGADRAVAVLKSMPEYAALFKRAFPGEADPVTFDNMARAIGAFERGLMTPSRWDALLQGDQAALTPTELVGLQTFLDAGCQSCHNGALLGGTTYQKLGIVKPYPGSRDPGRFDVTRVPGDRGVFKVPSLRNVERTGPYFHDGSVASLDAAVRQMGEYQLGRSLGDAEVRQIVAFLKVLTGKIDPNYIKPPVLPRSRPATPRPHAP